MLRINHSYIEISKDLQGSAKENFSPDKQVILQRMIENLPSSSWANIEILDWAPDDNILPVTYASYESPFGEVLIANTPKGVCYLGVVNDKSGYVSDDFNKRFGYAKPKETKTSQQKTALNYLNGKMDELLQFHLNGTPYQTEVWRRLLRIPFGKVISYATLADDRKHSRAAGTANGRNPIFYLVPCHRAVYTDGKFDRYSWGKDIKKRLLAWEFANSQT
ncbi:MAG: methylated-DNA--[protein]-cysteine S-methyltransferase [Tannerella sp.]|jgi:AraC family transcriptional regulator of adaptative response/methylated-DNA-[protein]-cysteine methyltransferase|nr:methylated-DNA--[protein]-cysteine S-methyltransferase [Tannerella sp.]